MKPSIRSLLAAWIEAEQPARIDRDAFAALKRAVAAGLPQGRRLSDRYLVDLLLATDLPVERSLGGIAVDLRGRLHTSRPDEALDALAELGREYEAAGAERRRDLRDAVLRAKDRLRPRLARPSADAEALERLWQGLLTWLENPLVFAPWLAAMRKAKARERLVN
ncbi:MAG: hypothetical protein GC160_26735 [Acidobacteria bacterium]|nr:hypothetical protein [Acidobacteriota bacterium]